MRSHGKSNPDNFMAKNNQHFYVKLVVWQVFGNKSIPPRNYATSMNPDCVCTFGKLGKPLNFSPHYWC